MENTFSEFSKGDPKNVGGARLGIDSIRCTTNNCVTSIMNK